MNTPYINTKLDTVITITPSQMGNNLYINIKQNLEKKLKGKCFKDYGYIDEIYNIVEYNGGYIEAEDLSASAKFNVTFACRLCRPLKMKKIICRVNKVNKSLMTLTNGPILAIVTIDRINDNNFFIDSNRNVRYKNINNIRKNNNSNVSPIVKSGELAKVVISAIKFNNGGNIIKVIGILDDLANDNEIELYEKEDHKFNIDTKEYNNYIEDI